MDRPEPVEVPIAIRCAKDNLIGIVHHVPDATVGFIFVVGGNQYRVGSHRLFVELARSLAKAGYSSIRFDHRGVGDNKSLHAGFESLQDDIARGIDEFRKTCPQVTRLVAIGLCDGASAVLLADRDIDGIDQLILVNPWVHTEELEARTRLIDYYGSRLRSKTFWSKLLRGRLRIIDSLASVLRYAIIFLKDKGPDRIEGVATRLPEEMLLALNRFEGQVLIILSGQDLVSQQFQRLATMESGWRNVLQKQNVSIKNLHDADHTFSSVSERYKFQEAIRVWCSRSRDI